MPDYAKSVNTRSAKIPIDSDEVLRRMLSMPPKQHDTKLPSTPSTLEKKKPSKPKLYVLNLNWVR